MLSKWLRGEIRPTQKREEEKKREETGRESDGDRDRDTNRGIITDFY